MQEIDENGTPMPSTSPKKSDISASHDDRAARIMAALISAQKENDEKRKKLQEDYEKAKAQYEAEKAILLAAAQESKRSMQNAGQIEVMPSEVIDEEDIEESLCDQMSALKKMRKSKIGALSSKDAQEIMSHVGQSAAKGQGSMELDSLF